MGIDFTAEAAEIGVEKGALLVITELKPPQS